MRSLGLDHLGIDERLALIQELWDSIDAKGATYSPTEAQRAELERRIADYEANPDDTVPWEEIRAAVLHRHEK
jgi:putative addiction module component (TIGR02574 family)